MEHLKSGGTGIQKVQTPKRTQEQGKWLGGVVEEEATEHS